MPSSGGLCAWVEVENTKVEEYNAETSPNGKVITCWIPSSSGKHFSAHWSDTEPGRSFDMNGRVYVDGIFCNGFISTRNRMQSCQVHSMATSETTERLLLFSNIKFSDDDSLLDASSSHKRLGQIEIEIWRVEITQQSMAYTPAPRPVPQVSDIHERSKKAMVHRATFGEERTVSRIRATVNKLDNVPFMTFVFKYRPIEQLQANDIAPRSTTGRPQKRPVPPNFGYAEADRDDIKPVLDVDSDTDSEQSRELQKLREQIAAIQANKRNKTKRIKIEHRERPVFRPGEVIDLT